jgi:hypothetical protein
MPDASQDMLLRGPFQASPGLAEISSIKRRKKIV